MTATTNLVYSANLTWVVAIVVVFVTQLVFVSQLSADVNQPNLKPSKGEQCVSPVETMRRDHMKILFAQRDRVVLQGIRNQTYSLGRCIACHVDQNQQGHPIPVNAPGQFCQTCHAYSGVKMDCFECHLAVPDQEKGRQVQFMGKDGVHSGMPQIYLGASR